MEPAAGAAGGPGDLVLPPARGDQGSGRARRRRGQPVAGCRHAARRASSLLDEVARTSSSTLLPRPPRRRSTPASSMTRSTCHRSTRRPDVVPTAGSWSSPHSTVRSVRVTDHGLPALDGRGSARCRPPRRDLATRSRPGSPGRRRSWCRRRLPVGPRMPRRGAHARRWPPAGCRCGCPAPATRPSTSGPGRPAPLRGRGEPEVRPRAGGGRGRGLRHGSSATGPGGPWLLDVTPPDDRSGGP